MKKLKLWICYYQEEDGDKNAFLFVSKNGTDTEAKKYIKNNFGNNYDKMHGVDVFEIDNEEDAKNNSYEIIVGNLIK